MREVKVESRVERGGEGSSDIQCLHTIYFFRISVDYRSFLGTFVCMRRQRA